MKIVFNDNTTKDCPDLWTAANLIHISQKQGGKVGYKVQLEDGLTEREQKKQTETLQWYVDRLRIRDR